MLDQSIEFGHISDADCIQINTARKNKGVEEIDFQACFDAGISWHKDAKSSTRNDRVKPHKEIQDWDPHASWFPNWQGRIALRRFDRAAYNLTRPRAAECSIFWFRLVKWAMQSWIDGTKWLEVRLMHVIHKKFKTGCVITLDGLGNCVVDEIFQVCGLKDLQALCIFLFGNAGLSMNDLNNKGIVAFTVVWPQRR